MGAATDNHNSRESYSRVRHKQTPRVQPSWCHGRTGNGGGVAHLLSAGQHWVQRALCKFSLRGTLVALEKTNRHAPRSHSFA